MKILNENFELLDSLHKITMADSFVVRQNKIDKGNGEAKLYVGHENHETRSFFGSKGFQNNCFFLRKDLIQFIKDLEIEYINPSQEYRDKNNFSNLYFSRLNYLESLPEKVEFTIKEQTQIAGPRIYINSFINKEFYNIMREISLPLISYLSVLKLQINNNIFYYYRLFTEFTEKEHPASTQPRVGQSEFRNNLLQDIPYCPFTGVIEPSLLIASHIKPWRDCIDDFERMDPKNGFMLTPSIDKLFDKGFITITNKKTILISPFFPSSEVNKIGIFENKIYENIPIEGRLDYLKYHNKYIFKGNL